VAESICLDEGEKLLSPLLPPTPKLLHLAESIERIISWHGACAAGPLLEWVLPRRVILGEVRRYFAITLLPSVI